MKNEKLQTPIRDQDLKTISSFVSHCRECGITTDAEELEFFEKQSVLFPVVRISSRQLLLGEENCLEQYIEQNLITYPVDKIEPNSQPLYDPLQVYALEEMQKLYEIDLKREDLFMKKEAWEKLYRTLQKRYSSDELTKKGQVVLIRWNKKIEFIHEVKNLIDQYQKFRRDKSIEFLKNTERETTNQEDKKGASKTMNGIFKPQILELIENHKDNINLKNLAWDFFSKSSAQSEKSLREALMSFTVNLRGETRDEESKNIELLISRHDYSFSVFCTLNWALELLDKKIILLDELAILKHCPYCNRKPLLKRKNAKTCGSSECKKIDRNTSIKRKREKGEYAMN